MTQNHSTLLMLKKQRIKQCGARFSELQPNCGVLGPCPSLTNKIYDRCSQQQSWRPPTAFKKTLTKQIYLEYPYPKPRPNKHNFTSE